MDRVDLNADIGEGGEDGELISLVSSVSIACFLVAALLAFLLPETRGREIGAD